MNKNKTLLITAMFVAASGTANAELLNSGILTVGVNANGTINDPVTSI